MPSSTSGFPSHIRDLPSPASHFLLGHLPRFQKGPKHLVLENWAQECGDLYRIRLGLQDFLVSTDLDFNGEVLKRRPADFRRHPKISEILEEIGVSSVFNAEGEYWARHRKPVAEALNLKKVKSFYPSLAHKTAQLLQVCQQHVERIEPLPVRSIIQRFTLDLTTSVVFGYPLNTLGGEQSELHRALQLVFPMVNQRMSAPLPTWRWWKSRADREFENALSYIRVVVQDFIEQARREIREEKDDQRQGSNFLKALLQDQQSHGLSDAEIFSAVFTLLLAGEDTSANSLAWAFFYLAQHPEVVSELRTEAKHVYGESPLPRSVEEHRQLKLAEAVAMETIRLKPTSPQLILQTLHPLVIQGLNLPAGTNVIVQNRVAQSRATYFSKPDEFLPQRWLAGQCPIGFEHQPEMVRAFGGGPRFCPGKHLALHEMVIVISVICRHFELELVEHPETIGEAYSFTMHPEEFGVRLSAV